VVWALAILGFVALIVFGNTSWTDSYNFDSGN
jgi:hypothetical protein